MMQSSPRTASAHSLLALLLSLLATFSCGKGPVRQPEDLHFEDQIDLLRFARDTNKWREGHPQRELLRAERQQIIQREKTDSVYLTLPGKPVVFSGLSLPGAASLHFGLLVAPTSPGPGGAALASFRALERSGGTLEWEQKIDLTLRRGQLFVPVEARIPSEEGITHLRLQVDLEIPSQASDATRVVLVRPLARFPIELRREGGERPRQVILITLDTFRTDHMGCYGAEDARTGHLDALAADSVRFTGCFSAANVTNPSHASMFTSMYPKDHKVIDNYSLLSDDCPTLMDGLKEEGFRRAAFVSAWNFAPSRSDFPRRFDEFSSCRLHSERRAEDVNTEAFPWLNRHREDDFFLWLHYFDVHMPYSPPYPFNTLYTETGSDKIELPLRDQDTLHIYAESDDLHHYRNMYRGEVAYLDQQLGVLIRRLKDLRIYDDCLLIVTSDHGESLGENGIYCEHFGLYDNTTSVPLLIKLPGQEATGVVDGLVSTVDIYPTIYDLIGREIDHPIRGQSLLPLMRDLRDSTQDRVFSEHKGAEQVSMRTRSHRTLLGLEDIQAFPSYALEMGRLELYRADRPMLLENNLAEQMPQEAEKGKSLLLEFLDDRMRYTAKGIEDPEYLEKLRQLGYVDDN